MNQDIFTAIMRQEFVKGTMVTPLEPLDWNPFTLEISSTARFENFAGLAPTPNIGRFLGYRDYSQIDQFAYPVENLEFSGQLAVRTVDVDDDQIGLYPIAFQQLGMKAADFPGVWVYQNMYSAGIAGNSIDGTNFFNLTHNYGSGNSTLPSPFGGGLNKLTYTSANTADGLTYRAIFLVHPKRVLTKPFGYQLREAPKLGTNSGTPECLENKQIRYWIDLRGNMFFGWWYSAILVEITNTPNLTDMFTIMDQVMRQFLTFKLPQGNAGVPALYTWSGIKFAADTATAIVSTGLWPLMTHALNEDRVGVSVAGSTSGITSNIYRGKFGLIPNPYMNGTGN
jgi:phage major head subunit gpT-like protein